MLERKEITLPRPEIMPELIHELEAFQYSVTESGTVRSAAPAGTHDDTVIALALAAWEARTLGPPLITSFGPPVLSPMRPIRGRRRRTLGPGWYRWP